MSVMRILWIYCIIHFIKPAYSQKDLREEGIASQSSTYQTYHANLSIIGEPTHDWNTNSCSATDAKLKHSWWSLSFPSETIFITDVVIYYRSDLPERLAGYSLYVTNKTILANATSPPSGGHLCYHHDESNIPSLIQNVTCNQLGKHVIIYNERLDGVPYPSAYSDVALLELCDVQVMGCFKSWWGRNCSKSCPSYCIEHHCHPTYGTCIWGCSSDKCRNNDCTNDGLCAVGCKQGQAGLFCNKKNVATKTVILKSGSSNQNMNAVTDGDKTNTSCVTLGVSEPWLQVDTGELRTIHAINLVFNIGFTTSGYSIFVSNISDARPEELHLQTDNILAHTNPFHVHSHNLSYVIGRYLVFLNTMDHIGICEVEIIGCPSDFYGDLCDMKCPLNCASPCHQESGICILGCKDGYTGSKCDEDTVDLLKI